MVVIGITRVPDTPTHAAAEECALGFAGGVPRGAPIVAAVVSIHRHWFLLERMPFLLPPTRRQDRRSCRFRQPALLVLDPSQRGR
jgi:hypothetical protein